METTFDEPDPEKVRRSEHGKWAEFRTTLYNFAVKIVVHHLVKKFLWIIEIIQLEKAIWVIFLIYNIRKMGYETD